MNKGVYEQALMAANAEIDRIENEVTDLDVRRAGLMSRLATLRETTSALNAVIGNQIPVKLLGLTGAVREIIRTATAPMTAADVRDQLERLRFDFASYEKPISSIATALNRLSDQKLVAVNIVDGKKVFSKRPTLADLQPPVPPPNITVAAPVPFEGMDKTEGKKK